MKELRSGEKGFVVVPGVFPPEEIAEARERILALIDSQGEKATHFQVSQTHVLIFHKQSLASRDGEGPQKPTSPPVLVP